MSRAAIAMAVAPMFLLLAASGLNAAPAALGPAASMPASQRNKPQPVLHHVDINSASRKELMTLPGIGAAEAEKIVARRPYLTKTELVSKGVLATGPFLALRHQVVAMQKFKSAPVKVPPARAGAAAASGARGS